MKTIISYIINGVLLIALISVSVWGFINFNKVEDGMKGTGLYVKNDIDAAYQDGYDTGVVDKTEYETLISEYRNKLTEFDNIKKELGISRAKTAELETKVSNLQTYVAECEQLIAEMKAENYALQAQVQTLENIRANLLQSINAYVQLIGSIAIIEERFVVTFMFDDTVYSIVLVPDGEKVAIINPVSTEYTIFLGWSLSQDGDLIDINELEISADTVIYAKIIRKYDINFILDYEIYEHHIIERGHTITANIPASTDRRVFKGWSLDGVNVINITDYPITEHRNFFAVVENRHEVQFITVRNKSVKTVLSTQYIGHTSALTVPPAPTENGYTFDGWLLNGLTPVTPALYDIVSDTVFVAKYLPRSITISGGPTFNTQNMYGQYDMARYLISYGHNYITNFRMLKTFAIQVRFSTAGFNRSFTITQNQTAFMRQHCGSFNDFFARGNLFFSISISGNGILSLQMSFEGSSLMGSGILNGGLSIYGMTFTLADY